LTKNIIYILIIIIIPYVLTEPLLQLLYSLFFSSDTYITHTLPFISVAKYFATAIVIILISNRYIHLTQLGKYVFPIMLTVCMIGFMISSLSFNTVSDAKLLKYRVILPFSYTWEDVDHVETKIYRDNAVARSKNVSRFTPLKVHIKYNIHFKNGASFNAWDNVDNVYELHNFVLDQHIDVQYNEMDLISFEQKYTSDFKNDMPKIKYIFYGINETK